MWSPGAGSSKASTSAALWVYWDIRKRAWGYTCTWAAAQVALKSVLRGGFAGRSINITKQHRAGAVRLGHGAQPAALWTSAKPSECMRTMDRRASQAWRCMPMFCGHRVQSMQLSGPLQHRAERRILAAGQYEAGAVRLGQHAGRAPGAPIPDTRRCHMVRTWLMWGVLVVSTRDYLICGGAVVGASTARSMHRYKDLNAAAAAFKHTHFALSTPCLFCVLPTIEILTSCCDLYVL